MKRFVLVSLSAIGMLLVAAASAWAFSPDTLVTVGSPTTPFSQNKQNEPAIAVDANSPNILVAGANDEIDMEACNAGDDNTCPFTPGVGSSGVYFSFDCGHDLDPADVHGVERAATASGSSVPDPGCSPQTEGPIGTLPWYFENGLVSDGDPAVAIGPKPGPGGFRWSNGERLYYANLTSNFGATRTDQTFKGSEAIARLADRRPAGRRGGQ